MNYESSFLTRDPSNAEVLHLNVHDILERHQEPYPFIMHALNDLLETETLILHVPFEPKPLMKQLTQMHYRFQFSKEAPDRYQLLINKTSR